MNLTSAGAIRFHEARMPRVWGAETWLIADHPVHTSVVAEGALQGRTLAELMAQEPASILGTHAKPTGHGRFPLLLKYLDARQNLSIQVHPDDDCAIALGEKDGGKTEMWHILSAAPGAKLYCGLRGINHAAELREAIANGTLRDHLNEIPAVPGLSVFIPAGTVHAIGAGVCLAEIQQNSDLTYRMDDWGRMGDDGKPREFHLEKSLRAAKLNAPETACDYFTAETLTLTGETTHNTKGESPHLLLPLNAPLEIITAYNLLSLEPLQAALIPAALGEYALCTPGKLIRYSIPLAITAGRG